MKICIQYEHDNLDAMLTLALGSLTGEKLTVTVTNMYKINT